MRLLHGFALLLLLVAAPAAAAPPRALFDNTHSQTAGNANWIIDNDQPVPSPPQSGITWSTPETYWSGANSAWGVQLVKRGYTVVTLTTVYGITYGNALNPYDLSNYDVFIENEPNTSFTVAESTAIFNFVRNGGGLVAISDHIGSDRNNPPDGVDSPRALNALDTQHLFGVSFDVSAAGNFSETSLNVDTAPDDSIIHGPNGVVDALAFHNGTSMTLYPAINPSVRGNVWRSATPQGNGAVMAAQAMYGIGRVFFVTDSSPADDGSASDGSNVQNGWAEAGGKDSVLFLNGTQWVTRRPLADTSPPTVTVTSPAGGVTWAAGSAHTITWTAIDNLAVTSVDVHYSLDDGAHWTAIATNIANSGSRAWNLPHLVSAQARVRVTGRDAAGNVGSGISGRFTIADQSPPIVSLIAPVGGESWYGASDQDVMWSADDNLNVDSLRIEYSLHGSGGPWIRIAGVPNSGLYTWSAPNVSCDSAFVRVTAYDPGLNTAVAVSDSAFHIVQDTGVPAGAAAALSFARPWPVPATGPVTLRFTLPQAGRARLDILDLAGRSVWRAQDGTFTAGEHRVLWSGQLASAAPAPAGVYFARLVTLWGVRFQRVVRLR